VNNPWQKFRKSWNNPVTKWKFLLAVLIGCAVIFAGGYGILSFTNSPAFCSTCHEMTPEYSTYKTSAHNQISCVDCHIKPGSKNMIIHKIKSTKEVYYHVTGAKGQIMQTTGEAISNQNCSQCHSINRLVTASGDLKVNHKGHIEKEILCITCHSGVVHGKIAVRGLNVSEYLNYWTKDNTKKVMKDKYLRPNMGLCIDCHEKVNNGESPWEDIQYSVPRNLERESYNSAKLTEEKEQNAMIQKQILQKISQPEANTKISLQCKTCHKEVTTPKSHQNTDWDYNHGNTTIKGLNRCLNCHEDSKWIKDIPKDDIVALFIGKDKKKTYERIRNHSFCSSCHSAHPPSHTHGPWMRGHAYASNKDSDKEKCYVCHYEKKPQPSELKAPAEVYCEYCHVNGFSGILNGRIGD
jgi:nitrate/TMAO reductase-like tetraheme cytochrome c subunit